MRWLHIAFPKENMGPWLNAVTLFRGKSRQADNARYPGASSPCLRPISDDLEIGKMDANSWTFIEEILRDLLIFVVAMTGLLIALVVIVSFLPSDNPLKRVLPALSYRVGATAAIARLLRRLWQGRGASFRVCDGTGRSCAAGWLRETTDNTETI